mgnify:CR=1 FL=1
MKVLLDTNVLVAAFISRGQCNELLEHCVRNHELVTSPTILDELERVLREKLDFPRAMVAEALELVRGEATEFDPPGLPEPVSRDPDDDEVLAAAFEGECDVIVTGDDDLLTIESYRDITILTPSRFWEHDLQSFEGEDDTG